MIGLYGGFFAILSACCSEKGEVPTAEKLVNMSAERQSALHNTGPHYIERTSTLVAKGVVTKIDTRNPFYTHCKFGLPGPGGSTRALYVNGLSCASAVRRAVQRVASLAPFSDAEKQSMPFGDVKVYDNSYKLVGTVSELTGSEGNLRACGFEPQTKFKGYLEPYKPEKDRPCSFIPDFLAVVMGTQHELLQS